jgi:hypothetical protein
VTHSLSFSIRSIYFKPQPSTLPVSQSVPLCFVFFICYILVIYYFHYLFSFSLC